MRTLLLFQPFSPENKNRNKTIQHLPCRGDCYNNCRLSCRRGSAGWHLLRRSRSFKVADFSNNRKPICDFLLVICTNLHPSAHRFQIIAEYWPPAKWRGTWFRSCLSVYMSGDNFHFYLKTFESLDVGSSYLHVSVYFQERYFQELQVMFAYEAHILRSSNACI